MAGIYLHFPFCKSRCSYCNFYSTVFNAAKQAEFVSALEREIVSRRSYLHDSEPIETIYFGGGTPSVLGIALLREVSACLRDNFDLSKIKEFTVECNPDDITLQFAESLLRLGANRVSMGLQSMSDDELAILGRRHNAQKAVQAVSNCKSAGFENISIDLMFGLPNQTADKWQYSIDKALDLEVQHISAYLLTLEDGTPILKYKELLPNEETVEKMYFMLCNSLKTAGFTHYEISNFARQTYESKHNSSYWQRIPYLGLGPSAHSFDGHSRQWNVSDLNAYIKGINSDEPVFEKECLTDNDVYNEWIMCALRTAKGLNLEQLPEKFRPHFLKAVEPLIKKNAIIQKNDNYALNENSYFVSDNVFVKLLF